MTKKKTVATRPSQDWRKDLQGATPEKLARALLRPVRQTKTNRPSKEGHAP